MRRVVHPVIAALAGLLAFVLAGAASSSRDAAPVPAPTEAVLVTKRGVVSAVVPGRSWRVELPWFDAGDADLAVSPDGGRIAFSSVRDGNPDIYVVDSAGQVTRLTASPRAEDRSPTWSPSGRMLAWAGGPAGRARLSLMAADGSGKRVLRPAGGDVRDPSWSPDGKTVAYVTGDAREAVLETVRVDGGRARRVVESAGAIGAPAWSPDGRLLAYTAGAPGRSADLWLVDVRSGKTTRLTSTGADERHPGWTRDGRRIVFARAESGTTSVWSLAVAGRRLSPVTGTAGDGEPVPTTLAVALVPGPEWTLPDLDQQAPRGIQARYDHELQAALLGFASSTDSIGAGALRIVGARKPGEATMLADQLVEGTAGSLLVIEDVGRMRYEPHPPHEHWHFQPFVRYELRRASDYEVVGTDRKTGFCLIDRYGRSSKKAAKTGPPRFVSDCETQKPDALRVEEGSSPGYVDRYPAYFHGQDIDITNLKAGLYVLVQRANPDLRLRESRYTNNAASALIRLSWTGKREEIPVVIVLERCADSASCGPARK
jgi:hypothetical protein